MHAVVHLFNKNENRTNNNWRKSFVVFAIRNKSTSGGAAALLNIIFYVGEEEGVAEEQCPIANLGFRIVSLLP